METDNQYPIGKLRLQEFSLSEKQSALADIQFLPHALEAAFTNLDQAQLLTPYRAGGWTVSQFSASSGRQSHQCVCSLQVVPYRTNAYHKTV